MVLDAEAPMETLGLSLAAMGTYPQCFEVRVGVVAYLQTVGREFDSPRRSNTM